MFLRLKDTTVVGIRSYGGLSVTITVPTYYHRSCVLAQMCHGKFNNMT